MKGMKNLRRDKAESNASLAKAQRPPSGFHHEEHEGHEGKTNTSGGEAGCESYE